jgi:nucleotide-binding universal stress UspA family protein
MNRIVVGIDGSEQGWSALTQAAGLAQATGSSLQIAHVTAPISPLAAEEYLSAGAEWVQAQLAYGQGLLREAAARVKSTGLEVQSLSRTGSPAETLAELANDQSVSMVVVGHRGRNLVARLFVGSVADRLVQISSKPVLVVH